MGDNFRFMGFEWIEEWDGSMCGVSWSWNMDTEMVRMTYKDQVTHEVAKSYFDDIRRGRFDANIRTGR